MQGFQVTITEKGGKPREEAFHQNEVTIGRVQGNDIVLPKGNISKRHSRIVLRDGKFIIVDLKSTNGTYVNGKRISSPQVLKEVDKIYIGDFTLQVEPEKDAAGEDELAEIEDVIADDDDDGLDLFDSDDGVAIEEPELAEEPAPPPPVEPEPEPEPTPPPVAAKPKSKPKPKPKPKKKPEGNGAANGAFRPAVDLPSQSALNARAAAFRAVKNAMDQLAREGSRALEADDAPKAEAAAERTLETLKKKQLAGENIDGWKEQIAQEVCALGPLSSLLEDEGISEIFINGPYQVLARREGPLEPEPVFFSSEEAVSAVVRRIMIESGVPYDSDHPVAEARLADGTRVNAVHQSASVKGPLVTITRAPGRSPSLDDLVEEEVLSDGMRQFLATCVASRRNVVICGGAGSGTDELLAAMASEFDSHDRIVVVEHLSQFRLPQPHVVTLEGQSAAMMPALVGNALRMRPDRLVVNELSGPEAMELAIAMSGSQEGTLVSTYAMSAKDCLDRFETMILMAGRSVPARAVREQIASCIDVIVCMTKFADATCRVTEVVEVTGTEVDIVTTQDLFTFKRDGGDGGRFVAKGNPPRFYEDLKARGENVDMSIFRDGM